MAKKSINESRKSTIQMTLALTAHSRSSEHSASSPENKSSNGSTRSEKEVVELKAEKQKLQHELKNTTNTSIASVKTKKNEKKTTITFVKAAANKNSANSNGKLVKVLVQKQTGKKKNATVKKSHLLPPSVQKAPRQVPNSHHAKSYKKVPPSPHGKPPHMKRRFTHFGLGSVDTRSSEVDTRPSFQQNSFAELGQQAVSTQSQAVLTLVPGSVDTRPNFQQNSFAEMGQQVDTRSGQVDTLRLKVKIVNFSIHVAAWDLGDLT
ncbi:hypothetical protein Taro_008446 [Colocasia esculenta]|uniref:Uncharacterized protein n=1 Tax=Colocasia esculenta TaxID=4460 RepID=A0A843TXK6_COLES|nr:hypothetical protein [Colocasia esculenta]